MADVRIVPGTVTQESPLLVQIDGEDEAGQRCQKLATARLGDVGGVLKVGTQRLWIGAYDRADEVRDLDDKVREVVEVQQGQQEALNVTSSSVDEVSVRVADAQTAAQQAVDEAGQALAGLAETVVETVMEYAVSSSETTPPTEGWSSDTPTRTPGTYVWMRVRVTRANEQVTYSAPTLATGNDGAPGEPGEPGAPGTTITGAEVRYQLAASGTTTPTGTWHTTPQVQTEALPYLWTRTVTSYSDGPPTTAYSVAQRGPQGPKGDTGNDGAPGAAGVGIASTEVTYAQSTSGTTAPTSGWTSAVPTLIKGRYLWTRSVWTYTDASTETGYSVAYVPQDGPAGDDGLPGAPGVGITGTDITYAQSTSGTTAPTTGWVAQPPSPIAGRYVWTKTVWTYSDNSTETGYSVGKIGDTGAKGDKGDKGDTGNDGTPGAAGVGIASTAISYAQSTSGTTAPTSGWQSTVPTLIKGRYLWTRSVWTYTDASTETGYSVAYVPQDGPAGDDGLPGAPGVGITNTTITYAQSTSGTTAPTSGWQAQPPAPVAGRYVWTRTVWTYSDSSTETGYSVGKIGDTGAAGSDGRAVTGTTYHYQASSSGTTVPTGTWSTTPPAAAPGQYVWTRTTFTFDKAPTTAYTYSVGKIGETGAKGDKGDTGNTGSQGISVTAVTPYYATVTAGGTPPTQPTTQATPPSPWTTTEPTFVEGYELWRTERISFSNGTYSWTTRQKSSAYAAAVQAVNLSEAAAQGLVVVSDDEPDHYKGRIWWQLDSSGRGIGIKISNGTIWQSYAIAADQLLIPSSVGPVLIQNGEVIAQALNAETIDGVFINGSVITGGEINGATFRTLAESGGVATRIINGYITFEINGDSVGSLTSVNWATSGRGVQLAGRGGPLQLGGYSHPTPQRNVNTTWMEIAALDEIEIRTPQNRGVSGVGFVKINSDPFGSSGNVFGDTYIGQAGGTDKVHVKGKDVSYLGGDTDGWVNLPLNSGLTGSLAYEIKAGRVEVRGQVTRTAGAYPTSYTAIATLPAAARPSSTFRVTFTGDNPSLGVLEANIASTGTISVRAVVAGPGRAWVAIPPFSTT